jgi:hypothetical protein
MQREGRRRHAEQGCTVAFGAFGVGFSVRLDDRRLLQRLERHLPPHRRPLPPGAVARTYRLEAATLTAQVGRRRLTGLDLAELLDVVERDLQHHIAARAPIDLFVHAGVVGWRGRAIVLPGRSQAGKSTLVAALIRAGATYYSDEYAVVDPRGWVLPYARPLSLRREQGPPRRPTASELGGRTGVRPLPVGLIALCRYRRGNRFRPVPLSPGRAVLSLLQNTVAARARSADALERLSQVAASARAVDGDRGEARSTARALLSLADDLSSD